MKTTVLVAIFTLISGELMASNLQRSKDFFRDLNANTLNLVDEFYHPDVVFTDPIHKISSSQDVKAYYQRLYSNVDSIRFEYGKSVESGSTVSLEWKMLLKTPAIAGGSEISVDGVSLITFDAQGKAIEHRDYFDMGEFVYERIPILSWIVGYIKKKMAGTNH